ncbi:MAG: TolC family protein [Thermoguttaceae bacterium]
MAVPELPKLTLRVIVLLLSGAAVGLAQQPYRPGPPEQVAAPFPQGPAWGVPPGNFAEGGPIFQGPNVAPHPQPPQIAPAQPSASDQPLPINLATALCLSNARPLVIASAEASVREAAAQLEGAKVLWVPSLSVGPSYYKHDGTDQSTDGTMILDDKHAFGAGGGATLNFAVTDAIFQPLAARRVLAAREWDLQATRNDALLAVALAYFDVQQARGNLAAALDAQNKADVLVGKTAGLARGLVPEIEVDRARALLFELRQEVIGAQANWRITSSRLTQILRLNPSAVVVPLEPPHLQVTLVSPRIGVSDLIPVAMTNRPELASREALVAASHERVRQEQLRPLLPSVVLEGAGPGGSFTGGVFGGGTDTGSQLYGGRFDMGVGLFWTLQNLGAGNRALVHQRVAQEQQVAIALADVQDRVAQDVVQAHAQVEAAIADVNQATAEVREATVTFNGNLIGIGETQRFGNLLQMVNRPQEATAALEELYRAYGLFYVAVNAYNRAQFQLYRALGFPARAILCDRPLGEVQNVDTSRPPSMPPVYSQATRPYP